MRIDIATLFPQLCETVMSESIIGRARKKELFELHCHQIRDYTLNKQKQVDDYPYGGGCGMVMNAQPIYDCCMEIIRQNQEQGRPRPHIVFMTAAGQPYSQQKAKELAQKENILLVCGHYEGIDERIPLDDEVIAGIPEAAAAVTAQRRLSDSADALADYGLDNPEITVKVTLKDGEEYTISIGSETSIASGRYIHVSGDDAVYLSQSGYEETFDTSAAYFAELVIVSALDESSTYSRYFSSGELIGFDSIRLSGSIYPQEVVLEFDPDNSLLAYLVTAPIQDYASETVAVEVLSPLSGSLYAAETYVLSPDAATLSEYGFDAPTSVIEYTIKDVHLTVTVGKSDGEGYYAVMIDDIPAIYKVSESNLSFAMYSTDELYYTSILAEAIGDIQSLTFKTPDNEYRFELEHTSTTTTDENGETKTTTSVIVRYNGEEISSVDFRTFYQHLLLMKSVEALPSDIPDAEPEYVITLTHVDSSIPDTVISFVRYSSRRYIAEKQGGRQLCITSDTVNAYVTYLNNLLNGEEVPEP